MKQTVFSIEGGTNDMKKKGGLFVKINYSRDERLKSKDYKDKSVGNDSNFSKYLLCAGVYNKNGGTMIFQAKDIEEAKDIISNNPFSHTKMYNYEILSVDNISL